MTSLDDKVKDFMRSGVISDEMGRKIDGAGVCRKCGDLVAMGLYTGKAQDVLCPRCLEKTKGAAYLMCGSCGNYMGEYKPGTTPDGYEVRPGDTLHLDCCPNCNPDAGSAVVVEFRDFLSSRAAGFGKGGGQNA